MAMVEVALRRRRSMGEGRGLLMASLRSSWWPQDRGRRTGAVGCVFVSGGQGRVSSMVTMATGLRCPLGGVWELPGTEAMCRAKAEVRVRLEAMGRGCALACPWAWPCTLWRVMASLGTSRPGQYLALLGRGLVPAGSGEQGQPPAQGDVGQR
jgi:hypothetical protein